MGGAAERKRVVTTAALVGRAGAMKALVVGVVVVVRGVGEGDVVEVEVLEVVMVVWEVEATAELDGGGKGRGARAGAEVGFVDVVGSEEDKLEGEAVT